jgi:hypothetical protein
MNAILQMCTLFEVEQVKNTQFTHHQEFNMKSNNTNDTQKITGVRKKCNQFDNASIICRELKLSGPYPLATSND